MMKRALTYSAALALFAGCTGDDVSATSATSGDTDTTNGTTASTTAPTTTATTATTTSPTTMGGTESDSATTSSTGVDTVSETTTTGPTTTMGPTTDPTTDPTTTSTTDPTTTGMPCAMGEIVCEDGMAKVCDGMGGYSSEELCEDACSEELGGCVVCIPDTGYCEGDNAFSCLPDGTGYDMETCDGLQGITCDENAGECVGACTPESLGTSYIGCDYYPTITPNPLLENINIFTFAVAVANTTAQNADVTVTRGGNMIAQVAVPANSVQVIPLPWVNDLLTGGNGAGNSKISIDGAYRLRSTQPVTVYQYNPLQYTANNQFSFTNDASLLLPRTAWRDELRVVAWNHFGTANFSAFYAVVAAEDDTQVTLSPSASGVWVRAGAGVQANGSGNVVLNSSDVLVVFSASATMGGASASDVSGTLVNATKPVQVFGGHICIYIPENLGYCDHIEESVPPLEAVGKDYFVTVPLINAPNQTKARMVRIVATEANTALTYNPMPPGAPTMLANPGDIATINATSLDFRITSEQKILVSEYMQGQDAGGNKGDPAMTLAVPVEQYRTNYLIHAPTNYTDSLANIVAPTGSAITVDGVAVNNWTAIGNGEYSVARVALANNGDGNHVLNGDQKFGIQVYGYGQYTSYWYPGGQNLNTVPQ